MLLLIKCDKLQVDEEGLIEPSGQKVNFGESRQRLFVEGVFKVFQLTEKANQHAIGLNCHSNTHPQRKLEYIQISETPLTAAYWIGGLTTVERLMTAGYGTREDTRGAESPESDEHCSTRQELHD